MEPFQGPDGATPLTRGAQRGLRQSWITTRGDLNEAERANILAGRQWAYRSRASIVDERHLKNLHRQMFGDVWSWAGQFRTVELNIGVMPHMIGVELRSFLDDVGFWLEHQSYPPDELAVRFHHRLVWIHPFNNGNGRHSRLATDLLCRRIGRPEFTWGSTGLDDSGPIRRRYIDTLRAADAHDIAPLLAFARS